MGWERYDSPKFELEKPSVFGKCILTPWASKNPKTYSILPWFDVFMFSSPFSFTWSSGRQLELPVCETIHIFGCYLTLFRLRNCFWWLSVAKFPSPHFAAFFSIIFKMEIIFLEIPSEWKRRPTSLSVTKPILATLGKKHLWEPNCV